LNFYFTEKIEEGQIPNTNGIRLEELDEESDEDEEENLDNVILPSRKRMPDSRLQHPTLKQVPS